MDHIRYSSTGNCCSRIWVFFRRVEPSSAYLLTTSLSPGSCAVLVISAGPAHPAPSSQPPAGACNGEPPGKLKYFLRWKYFQPFFWSSVLYICQLLGVQIINHSLSRILVTLSSFGGRGDVRLLVAVVTDPQLMVHQTPGSSAVSGDRRWQHSKY